MVKGKITKKFIYKINKGNNKINKGNNKINKSNNKINKGNNKINKSNNKITELPKLPNLPHRKLKIE